ncbi:hypothetical protein [Clostridium paridis]|uniref:Uncharacterized protein n=1 Tax=Clostridium paridis TaxID=2803863 RepID=A0A937FIZ3_9CLOT|nr:hypothetical protein [Clostridium paridis]MBL4933037.1 hypothetical protein [Clostridium paridis]
MAKKNSKKSMSTDDLSFEDNYEENGFSNVIVGTPLSNFSFCNESNQSIPPIAPKEMPSPKNTKAEGLIDNRVGKPTAFGMTPPIDGEAFEIKRTYAFRKSTVRKLNELKAQHPDINAYLSSILDAAVNHYYNHIIFENGVQK